MVAGGGLSNGNACATIEIDLDADGEEKGKIHYCEYGKNAYSRHVGSKVVWGSDGNSFNVV
jgi:hypothetical protein